VEVEPRFAKRLPVIRHVEERRVHAGRARFEAPDEAREHAVGFADRIVVGIDDFLARAAPEVGVPAFGFEGLDGFRRTL